MSWSSGSRLFSEIISTIVDAGVDTPTRKTIYNGLIVVFQNEDCDTLEECLGEDSAFDSVWKELNPEEEEWIEDED